MTSTPGTMVRRMRGGPARALGRVLLAALVAAGPAGVPALAQARDVSKESARSDTPAWVKNGVVYEIFPRVFSAEGNFDGVTAQLDRLKELGVNILWLMPVHPLGQEKKKGSIGSPYAVRDYYGLNPDYGTADDFKRLVREAHRREMKVFIDVVANHTSWDSVMMKTPEFYVRDTATGRINSPHDWTDVAELNYESPALRKYMTDMLVHWVREFDLDGFRCDVAAEVPTDFWEQAREALERVKPDIALLAESDRPELLVRAFDFDYAWPMHGTLNDVLHGRRPASALRETWASDAAKYPRGALRMRFSDNHDERRAIARFGEPAALAASALMLTLDGVPLLYNGMEVGDTAESGDPALFERLLIFWPIVKRRPHFPRFYQRMIALRRAHPALQQGEVVWLRNNDESRVLTFLRRAGAEEFLVAVNLSKEPFVGTVEAAGEFADVTPDIHSATPAAAARPAALPALALDPWGFRVFRRTAK